MEHSIIVARQFSENIQGDTASSYIVLHIHSIHGLVPNDNAIRITEHSGPNDK